MRLGELIHIKTHDPDADFWVVRKGSLEQVGRPTRTYNPEYFGITVTDRDKLLPDYLFYMLTHMANIGYFRERATGSIRLVNIRKPDITSIAVGTDDDEGFLIRATRSIRDMVYPSFSGSGEFAARELADLLVSKGFCAHAVAGQYNSPTDGDDGENHPFTLHWWVECDGKILDPTREQFGSSKLVTDQADPDYRSY